MAALKRGWRRLSSHTSSDLTLSETDGPALKSKQDAITTKKWQKVNKDFLELPPDKQLEEKVLCDCSEYLTNNLPADDVAPVMLSRNLLTPREHDEYKAMKRSGRSTTSCMSEYLLECLRKRQAGFLKQFCGILWEIEAAKYLGDHLCRVYNETNLQEGINANSRDRLSKISLSDPDIRPKTPQDNITLSCAVCRKLRKRNRQLEKFNTELKEQLIELDKDYHQLQEAKSKVEGQLEILQDQLQQEGTEKQNLKRIVPHLQEAITLIESSCRASATGTAGAQHTLKRIRDLLHEQSKHEKLPTVIKRRHIRVHLDGSRDSMLSMFSDNSSVAESPIADEDMTLAAPERNRPSMDIGKPVISDLHRSMTQSQTMFKSQSIVRSMSNIEPSESSIEPAAINESSVMIQGHQRDSREHAKEESFQGHIRSESVDTTASKHTKSHSNAHPRKARHNSESDVSLSLKQGRSQSFRHSYREEPNSQPRPRTQTYRHVQGDELSAILNKRREKLESESEASKQYLTHKSQ